MNYFWRDMAFAVTMIAVIVVVHAVDTSPVHEARAVVEIAIPPAPPVAPKFSAKELGCVRNAVFGEARGEPAYVQLAVAATIVNRALKSSDDLCKVVKKPRQFQGYSAKIILHNEKDVEAWDRAMDVTVRATYHYDSLPKEYKRTLYFHTANSGIDWRDVHTYVGQLGGLIFYGQS